MQAEKSRLSEAEAKALAEHEQTVQANSKAIVTAATKEASAIKASFDAQATTLEGKIQAAIA